MRGITPDGERDQEGSHLGPINLLAVGQKWVDTQGPSKSRSTHPHHTSRLPALLESHAHKEQNATALGVPR